MVKDECNRTYESNVNLLSLWIVLAGVIVAGIMAADVDSMCVFVDSIGAVATLCSLIAG